MRVLEIFRSIQGEGRDIGVPAVFVRFAGCSYGCLSCDTREMMNTIEVKDMQVGDIVDVIGDLEGDTVILTGGEPLEQNAFDLCRLIEELERWSKKVIIETNGKIFKNELFYTKVFYSISPKLSILSGRENSLNDFTNGVRQYLRWNVSNVSLKFVVSGEDNGQSMKEVLIWLNNSMRDVGIRVDCPIIFQPCWSKSRVDVKDYDTYFKLLNSIVSYVKGNWLAESFDIRVLPQLHKLLGVR